MKYDKSVLTGSSWSCFGQWLYKNLHSDKIHRNFHEVMMNWNLKCIHVENQMTWSLRHVRSKIFVVLLGSCSSCKLTIKCTLHLKEHCTQKKIWIHLMQNMFRNQTVKNLAILDNPLKNHISWMDYPFLSKFLMFIAKKYLHLMNSYFFLNTVFF